LGPLIEGNIVIRTKYIFAPMHRPSLGANAGPFTLDAGGAEVATEGRVRGGAGVNWRGHVNVFVEGTMMEHPHLPGMEEAVKGSSQERVAAALRHIADMERAGMSTEPLPEHVVTNSLAHRIAMERAGRSFDPATPGAAAAAAAAASAPPSSFEPHLTIPLLDMHRGPLHASTHAVVTPSNVTYDERISLDVDKRIASAVIAGAMATVLVASPMTLPASAAAAAALAPPPPFPSLDQLMTGGTHAWMHGSVE